MKCKLGDYIRIKHGFAFKGEYITAENNGVVLVTPGNFEIGGGFKEDKCKYFNGDYPKEYVLSPYDLIVTMTDLSKQGDTLGYSALVPKTNRVYLHNQRIGLVDVYNPKADKMFIYWLMRTQKYQKTIVATSSGSTVKHTSPSRIYDVEVDLPPIDVQKKIAAILSALDEKIEINREINDNLYAQAKATTKQWISKSTGDYELLPLSDIASINPDTYSPKETWKYVNYLDTSSITEGCIAEIQHITPSSEKLPSRARRKIAPNDIVFSTVRPNQRHYGIISEPLPNMLGSTGFAVIRSKNPLVCNELIYLCLTENEFIEKMQQLAEQSTSTFPSIKPSDLGVCEISCPKDQSSTSFTETLKSLFALIAANQRENISLSEIRDALLPKLMSGEIDVSDIQL